MRKLPLKIGLHSYDITERDVFRDNGKTVRLVTQSKALRNGSLFGRPAHPVLSARARREIAKFERTNCTERRVDGVLLAATFQLGGAL